MVRWNRLGSVLAAVVLAAGLPVSARAHTGTSPAIAATPIVIQLDGQTLKTDVAPQIKNDRAFVPLRTIFEALGYQVSWNDAEKTVTARRDDQTLLLTIGSDVLTKKSDSSTRFYALDAAPYIWQERTLVPLRAIAESSGASVNWDSATRMVTISTQAAAESQDLLASVVTITTNATQGSGFVLESSGVIVTNCHVLAGATVAAVTFGNGAVYADDVTVLGYDLSSDLALLKIQKANLPTLPVGSSKSLTPGSAIRALGSPAGKQNTVTPGQVTQSTADYLITDAAVHAGNSGGPVVNEAGEVVGVVSFSVTTDAGATYQMAQRAEAIARIDRSQPLTLSEFNKAYHTPTPPRHLSVTQEGNQVYVNWEFLPNAKYYVVAVSDSREGEYTPLDSPLADNDYWAWNYPYCFGLTLQGRKTLHAFVRVAAVVDGHVSAWSQPVEINVKA